MSPARLVASWFGAGLAPFAPGTCGTLAAVPLYLLAWRLDLPSWSLAAAALALVALGIPASERAARELGDPDPPEVVIDEVAGFALAAALVALAADAAGLPRWSWTSLLGCVLAFRLLDIWKPWPIGRLQDLPGGWGVMVDDVAAGLAAGALVAIARALLLGAPPAGG